MATSLRMTEPEKSQNPSFTPTADESWDGENDPKNPFNWSKSRKVLAVAIVSLIGFSTPFASDVSAPAIGDIMAEFHGTNEALSGFVVSVFVLDNAIGPIFFAPLSEIVGRAPVLNACNILFLLFTISCALANSLPLLCVLRFFAGCAGAAPLAVGGGTIADLIPRETRGRYFAIFAAGAQLAPVLAPLTGGFLTQHMGWRWTFWIVVMIHGPITILTAVSLKETYAPVLLRRKALISQRANQPRPKSLMSRVKSAFEFKSMPENPDESSRKLKLALIRPLKMLVRSPVVLLLSIIQAIAFGYRYLLYTTMTEVFQQQYGFSTGTAGLTLIGSAICATIALIACTKICDGAVTKAKALQPEVNPEPEVRLPAMIFGSPLMSVGLLLYGWPAKYQIHWIVPVIGTALFGAGITAASLPVNLYMVDAFTEFAASGLAASFLLRSLAGGILPLAGWPMLRALGVGWASTTLALIALVMCAAPPLLYKYGAFLRAHFPVHL